jgi:FkbM family methyltransferase
MFSGTGACDQIDGVASRPRPKINNIRKVKGYCIEPARKTFEVLKAGMESLAGDGVVLSQMAMGAFRGYVSFPDIEAGIEYEGISREGIQVQAMTLDEYAEAQDLRVIDLLSVDTEGNDMNVLYGSINLLSRHFVRVLEFEVHDVGHWKVSRLDNVVALLDNLGMVCYWHLNGNHPILRATRCMSEAYEAPTIKWWSNMVCVNQNESKLLQLLESLSDQAEEALKPEKAPYLTVRTFNLL